MDESKKLSKECEEKQNSIATKIVMSRHWLNFWCYNRIGFCHDMISFYCDKVGAKIDKQEKVCHDIFSLCHNKQQT